MDALRGSAWRTRLDICRKEAIREQMNFKETAIEIKEKQTTNLLWQYSKMSNERLSKKMMSETANYVNQVYYNLPMNYLLRNS